MKKMTGKNMGGERKERHLKGEERGGRTGLGGGESAESGGREITGLSLSLSCHVSGVSQ